MPGGDRTGPAGLGPMTGRGAGYCAEYPAQGFMSSAWGRGGGGRGWGGGRGGGGRRHRHWYNATGVPGWQRVAAGWPVDAPPTTFGPLMNKERELEALKIQARYLEQALDDLQKRITEVASPSDGAKTE